MREGFLSGLAPSLLDGYPKRRAHGTSEDPRQTCHTYPPNPRSLDHYHFTRHESTLCPSEGSIVGHGCPTGVHLPADYKSTPSPVGTGKTRSTAHSPFRGGRALSVTSVFLRRTWRRVPRGLGTRSHTSVS